jgi:primosomal protein N' (replication factor Y)
MSGPGFALVTLPGKVRKSLLYSIPGDLAGKIVLGTPVQVPLRGRMGRGVVTEIRDRAEGLTTVKPVHSVPDPGIRVSPECLRLADWMSRYYLTPPGEVLKLFLPRGFLASERLEIKWIRREEDPEIDDPSLEKVYEYIRARKGRWIGMAGLTRAFPFDVHSRLKTMEKRGWVALRHSLREQREGEIKALDSGTLEPSVADGEDSRLCAEIEGTGTGEPVLVMSLCEPRKSRVLYERIRRIVDAGGGVLCLIPERPEGSSLGRNILAWAPGVSVLYHGGLSNPERMRLFKDLNAGAYRVVVGPRSAILLPMPDLRLIVVDDEHDDSYKQKETPPLYWARDVAVMRGRFESAGVILLSGTPSMESLHSASEGKMRSIEAPSPEGTPEVVLVDMREERATSPFSIRLLEEIRENLERGGRTVLFVNRRGFSPGLRCLDCGHVPLCPDCSGKMAFHEDRARLICHLCGGDIEVPSRCPECGSERFVPSGYGTQRVVSELKRFFPEERVLRLDADTTVPSGLQDDARLIVGTQSLILSYPSLQADLGAALLADVGLGIPDFRAEERTFQVLSAFVRRIRPGGLAIIQTFSPDAAALRHLVTLDPLGFYQEEIGSRAECGYPPVTRLALVEFRGRDEDGLIRYSERVAEGLRRLGGEDLTVLGPAPSPRERLRGLSRWRILIESRAGFAFQRAMKRLDPTPPRGIRMRVNVDPVDLM